MLLAFHGKKEIKAEYLARVKAHQKADEIAKGVYYEKRNGKMRMCAVGCTIHGSDHGAYETELGIPRKIARLEDGIFEGLPEKEAKVWPYKFLNTIKLNADLSLVADKFLHWLLVDDVDGVIKFAKNAKQKKAIQDVGDLYARKINGENITDDTWIKARSDASAGAAYATSADATSADATSADAYAASAAASAAYAAGAAASSAAAYAYAAYAADAAAADARQKARSRQAEKLLELLKAAPIIKKVAA